MDSEGESSQLMDDDSPSNDEEYERLQSMARYLRSKSLPVVYFPPAGGSGGGGGSSHHHHPHMMTDRNAKILHAIRENSTESEESRRSSGFNSSVKNEPISPGVKPDAGDSLAQVSDDDNDDASSSCCRERNSRNAPHIPLQFN